jgi:hypothetical protein
MLYVASMNKPMPPRHFGRGAWLRAAVVLDRRHRVSFMRGTMRLIGGVNELQLRTATADNS